MTSAQIKLLHVVGARPNLPKLAPVYRAAARVGLRQVIVHTGQHYDDALSGSFLRELGIRQPDLNLGVGSDSHAVQTARIMERIEPVLVRENPEWTVVYGDVNSTLAAACVASKLGIRIAHVEAGLRSYDRSMPEEINRIVTDRLANLLLTPSRDASETLRREGEPESEIEFVGNVMIDSVFYALDLARNRDTRRRLRLDGRHVVVTLHRPSNVDEPSRLAAIAAALSEIGATYDVVFPVHPRTSQRIEASGLDLSAVKTLEPLGYLDMLNLVESAFAVVTDSGGIQEETTALGVPCFTVRENTERPITISEGTNTLVPNPSDLPGLLRNARRHAQPPRPAGWDGKAAERVVSAITARPT